MCDISERTVKHPSETMKRTGLCGKCRRKICGLEFQNVGFVRRA